MPQEDRENKTERVQLLMSPSEVEAIDDWGFKNRIRTRAEAIRRLCQIALTFDRHSDELNHQIQHLTMAMGDLSDAAPKESGDIAQPDFLEKLQAHDKMTAETFSSVFELWTAIEKLKTGKDLKESMSEADFFSKKVRHYQSMSRAAYEKLTAKQKDE